MASIDRDYVLGIAVQLQSESIQEIQAQLQAAADKIKPISIKAVSDSSASAASGTTKLTTALKEASDQAEQLGKNLLNVGELTASQAITALNALDKANAASERRNLLINKTIQEVEDENSALSQQSEILSEIASFNDEQDAALRTQAKLLAEKLVLQQKTVAEDEAAIAAVQEYNSLIRSLGSGNPGAMQLLNGLSPEDALAQQRQIIEGNDKIRSQIEERNALIRNVGNGTAGFGGPTESFSVAPLKMFDEQSAALERYVPAAKEAIQAQEKANSIWGAFGNTVRNNAGAMDHFVKSMGNIATWGIGAGVLFGGANLAMKGFQDAIKSQQEQVVQGFYYNAAGTQFTPQMSDTTMKAAIQLATKYGQEVMHVQEALGLWAKVDGGDLNTSLYLTNNLLKLSTVSGMHLEDAYRDTVGMLGQYNLSLDHQAELYNMAIGMAQKYGGGIKMLGGESEDAAANMIEGMTRASAVVASFGMKASEAAAMVSTLVHLSGSEMSGTRAGQQVSQALNTFTKAPTQAALTAVGIKYHENPHMFDQVIQKWNEVVKGGGGKTLGDIVSKGVSPFARETFDVLTKENNLIIKMRHEAEQFGKSDILDKLFGKIHKTTANELQRLQTGFEALSIVIGRAFLPEIDGISKSLNGALMPSLIASGAEIGGFIKDVSHAVLIIGGIQVVKFAISGIIGLGQSFGVAANNISRAASLMSGSMTSVMRSELMAKNSFSDLQRSALAAAMGINEVTPEIEGQFRALAVSSNKNIDSMILALGRLKGTISSDATVFTAATGDMKLSLSNLASAAGVDVGTLETKFGALEVAGVSTAEAIGAAFNSMLGPIGWIITAISVLPMVGDYFKNKANVARMTHLETDQTARVSFEHTHFQSARNALAQAQRDQYVLNHPSARPWQAGTLITDEHGVQIGMSAPHQVSRATIEADWKHNMDVYHRDLALGKGVQNGTLLPDYVANAINKGAQKAKDQYVVKNGVNSKEGAQTPSAKAVSNALNAQSAAVKRNVEAWTSKLAVDEKAITTARLETRFLSDKTKAVNDLTAAYHKAITDTQIHANVDAGAIAHLEQLANKATGPQQQKFLTQANALRGQLNNLEAEVKLLRAKESLDLSSLRAKGVEGHFGAIMAGIQTSMRGVSKDTVPQMNALHTIINNVLYDIDRLASKWKNTPLGDKLSKFAQTLTGDLTTLGDKTKTVTENVQSFIGTSTNTFQSGLASNKFELANISTDPSSKAFAQAINSATTKFDAFMQKWNKWETEAGDSTALENVKALAQTWYQSSIALANYNHALAEVKSSPAYAAVTALGNDIGSTLTSDVMSGFNRSDMNQVAAIQSQITALENEKNLLTGKNSEVERMMLEKRIQQLQAEKNGINQRMQHPGFIKSIMEDMTKAAMKGVTDRITKDLQDAFVNTILGKDPANNPVVISSKQNTISTDKNTTALGQLTDSITRAMQQASPQSVGSASIGGGSGSDLLGTILSGSGAISGFTGSLGGGSSSPSSSSNFSGPISSTSTLPAGSFNFGSVPFGGSQSIGGGSTPSITGAMIAGALSPGAGGFFNVGAASQVASAASSGSGGPSSAGFWSSGKGNAQHIMGALGGLSTAVQGYDQGGFTGSLESGLGMFEALSSVGVPPQIAIPIAAADFILSLFHPHYNPSQNPDMYADSGYAQGLANAQGVSHTQADGTVYEDPGLKQQLGGMTELQYLDAWYNAYPGGQGLNEEGKQLWDEIGHITGNGKGMGVQGLHQGNVYVASQAVPGSPQVGESGNWQTVLQDIDSATQQLYTLENKDMSGKGTWISMNSYGAGGGASASISPWYSPGLNSSDVSAITSMPYPPINSSGSITTSPGDPSGGSGGPGSGPVGGPGGGVSPMNVTSSVYLNTEVIAQAVNAYNIQRQQSGWAMNY